MLISEYENYLVTECGKVISRTRYETFGNTTRRRNQKELSSSISNAGYKMVSLYKDCKYKRFSVHRLVAQAYVPNPNNFKEVNHIDGDKLNNHKDNLEWVSRVSNAMHSARVLGKNRGEEQAASKLTEKDVLQIKGMLEADILTQSQIGAMYGVTNYCISRIKCGKNWAWLTGYGKEDAYVTRN